MKRVVCLSLSVLLIFSLFSFAILANEGVQDGTYTVETAGMYDGITLEVTFEGGKIADVTVISHNETPIISDLPISTIPAHIVEKNSVNVDTIAGATSTSVGIIEGVKQAIIAAGGTIENFQGKKIDEEIVKEVVELRTDVVVAGAGMAGLSVALSAADNGLDVILLEKMPFTGGTLGVSGGYFISVDSPVYARLLPNGPADDLENALTAFINLSNSSDYNISEIYPNVEKLELHYSEIGATHLWMEGHNVVWDMAIPANPGNTLGMVRGEGGGSGVAQTLTESIQKNDKIDLHLQTAATELIIVDGNVTGIVSESATQILRISAEHIVIATGGFASNFDMVEQLVPDYVGTVNTAAAGNTGDGFRLAKQAGAAFFDDHWMVSAYPVALNSNAAAATYGNRILVDQAGQRIVNEAAYFSIITNAIATNPTKTFAIFDSTIDAHVEALEASLPSDNVYKGSTLQELAAQSGIDGQHLANTVNNYNGYAISGHDLEFNKATNSLVEYAETGPYYAVEYTHSVWGSMSGAITNEDYSVIHEDGSVITGLYAIGEMSNKDFYNRNYHGGSSLSLYSTMGRLLGEKLAK